MAAMTHLIATCIALNFQLPADGTLPQWVQVIPKPDADGYVTGTDGRRFQVRDVPALVTALNAQAHEVPFDINHATRLKALAGDPSPAIGWPLKFEARDGAIWAQPDWNDDGKLALNSKHYRFISPGLFHDSAGVVVGLHSISLTNHPNFIMPALNQRQAASPDPDTGATPMKLPESITSRLGLNAEASESVVVTALDNLLKEKQVALNAAQTPDPAKFVPKPDHDRIVALNAQLQKDAKTRQNAEIEAEVDAAVEAGHFAPASREHYVALCHTEGGLERFRELVKVTPPIAGDSGLDAKQVALNSKGAGKGQLTDTDLQVCALTGRDPQTLLAAD